jgi:predicted enzyme related to lactoylglutathione lyase
MGAPVAWFETGYSLVDTGAAGEAIGATQGHDDPGGVTVYMRVEDLQAALDRAEALGGKPLVPPTDLPDGYGRFAMFADPDGHTVGLWS